MRTKNCGFVVLYSIVLIISNETPLLLDCLYLLLVNIKSKLYNSNSLTFSLGTFSFLYFP